ncbi:MAG TPA: hypothetical protein VNP96_05135 [Solirubrobacterales bacterium]|nr:hypothetical protein [Solirubrobacterales bacterium]
MRAVLGRLTYANVVATMALFLALGGGAVWAAEQIGKNAVKSKNIAANAVKSQDIARNAVKGRNLASNAVKTRSLAKNAVKASKLAANAVTNRSIAKEAVDRAKLKAGTLAGLQILDVQATGVPGLTTESTGAGFSIPFSGPAVFTPAAGKSYELLAELRGTPSDANGGEPGSCFAGVQIYVNGEPFTFLEISASASAEPPFNVNNVGSTSTALGLLTPGQAQTISAGSFGDPACGGGTSANLRITVVELG